nr:hypothetical protein [uncultured Brevundimonas sp.]
MDASYHDFLEAAYFGRYSVFDRARNNYGKPGIPYRNDRAGMDSLTAKPSYHFSRDLTLALANHVMEPVGGAIDLFGNLLTPHNSLHADTPEGERLAGLVNGHLDTLGLDNVALVFEGPPGGTTIAVITCFEWFMTNYLVAVWQESHGWMMLDGGHITGASNVFMGMAEKALSLLANPAVEYVMRQPSSGMATMSKNRERKGEEPVADMQIVHLTKRIYVNGLPLGGERGSHASPKPHDRQGHYRTRATPAPGWEGPFVPSSGEFKGMTRYRRWFDKTTVMGGAPGHGPGRGHPKAAQPKAPQFRVVK